MPLILSEVGYAVSQYGFSDDWFSATTDIILKLDDEYLKGVREAVEKARKKAERQQKQRKGL